MKHASPAAYSCLGCSALWPVVKGIPRFVDSEHYVGSFGWEWRRHKRTQIDDATSKQSEETFAEKTGLTPEDVRGKRVLDVGVGSGRFSHVVGRWGGIPVGVDLSLAVLSAKKNLARFPGSLVCQGDAFKLPFKEESFDVVFSIGVLHHTPSTRTAFRSAARFVKPGGVLAVALYDASSADFYEHATRYRRYTTELPHSLLHLLSHAAIPVYHALDALRSYRRGKHLAGVLHKVLMTRDHPDPLWQVLDTFDWYSPRYQWLHDEDEVKRWFVELGFERVRRTPDRTMVSVRGERAAAGPLREPPPSEESRVGELEPLPGWLPGSPASVRAAALVLLLALEVGRSAASELGALAREAAAKARSPEERPASS
jgi:ubiquinone/menaquinone biosynthesis C-methylase UbiE